MERTQSEPKACEPKDINMTPSIKTDAHLVNRSKSVNPALQVDSEGMLLEGSQTF